MSTLASLPKSPVRALHIKTTKLRNWKQIQGHREAWKSLSAVGTMKHDSQAREENSQSHSLT